MPFCFQGLAPPPRTSARVLVLWVPDRRAASWAVTTWCMTATLGSMPKSVVELDRALVGAGGDLHGDRAITHHPLRRRRLDGVADDDEAALGAGDGAPDQQQAGSASASTTWRFSVVTFSPPMRPAMRVPLNTRAGVAQAPTEPGRGARVGTVAGLLAGEAVALHGAGEALAPADGGDVDEVAGRQHVDGDLLADLVAR